MKIDCFDKSKEWANYTGCGQRATGDGQNDAIDLGADIEVSALRCDAPAKHEALIAPLECTRTNTPPDHGA
ncbi:MAG TPA: hypothetical protein VIT67_12060 [Povalibacter sp.]